MIGHYKERRFICYIHFIGLDNVQLGLAINWKQPNVEIHIPFCFIRVGWQGVNIPPFPYRNFGLNWFK